MRRWPLHALRHSLHELNERGWHTYHGVIVDGVPLTRAMLLKEIARRNPADASLSEPMSGSK